MSCNFAQHNSICCCVCCFIAVATLEVAAISATAVVAVVAAAAAVAATSESKDGLTDLLRRHKWQLLQQSPFVALKVFLP